MHWTPEEDSMLSRLVGHIEPINWVDVANRLNATAAVAKRTSRQCRDRWLNYLNPDIKR